MSSPILYSFRRCPYAIRARMAVLASGLMCELREISLADKPEALVIASPKATIPVMVLPDGQVLDQSLDIMKYALGINDPQNWLDGVDIDTTGLIVTNDEVFKGHLDQYKYPGQYDDDALTHRDAGLAILMDLEARLSVQPYLAGNACRFVDVAIFPFIRQFAAVNEVWFGAAPIPKLQAWLARFLASDVFQVAMVPVPIWSPGDVPRKFPDNPLKLLRLDI